MRKLWPQFKSFIGECDFADAFKDIADDIKKTSVALFILWLLSQVHRLPLVFAALPKILGVDAEALPKSDWVTWALLGAAIVLYVIQFLLRVKSRTIIEGKTHHDKDNTLSNRLGINSEPLRRSTAMHSTLNSRDNRVSSVSQTRGSKTTSR